MAQFDGLRATGAAGGGRNEIMTEKDKAAQRSTLIFQLGKLLAPLFELAERTPPPTAAEYQIAAARGIPDSQRWNAEVDEFATVGGYRFGHLVNDIVREPHNLLHVLPDWTKTNPDDASRQATLRERLAQCRQLALEAIDRVPIEWTARLHEAQTPFSVYLKIRDAIGTAKRRVHYFDRYLDTEFFHLYLRDLDRGLEVRLVTTKGKTSFGVTNVLPVSRLAAGEFANYQLIECLPADLHDRNLRIDDRVFFLGTSIKDAGTQPTNFSPGDSTTAGHAVLDGIMGKGTVIT
jgi:hypothetical protein